MAGISTDPLYSTALLQAEMFIPFDLLRDLDRSMLQEWDLLNTKERDGIAVPAVFAIGTGRTVLARSVDTMMHQIHPLEFLKTAESETRRPGRRQLMLPRIFEFLKVSLGISRAGEEG